MLTIQFESTSPTYKQIVNYFYQKISNGDISPGEKMPSVREAARLLMVNPNTISRSYLVMKRDGVIFTQQGQGTYVNNDEDAVKELCESFAENLIKELIVFLHKFGFTDIQIKKHMDVLLNC